MHMQCNPLREAIYWYFPGGLLVRKSPASAGDTSSIPGLGRSHIPRSNQACKLSAWSLCSATREAHTLQQRVTPDRRSKDPAQPKIKKKNFKGRLLRRKSVPLFLQKSICCPLQKGAYLMTDCDYCLFSGFYCRNIIIIVIYKSRKIFILVNQLFLFFHIHFQFLCLFVYNLYVLISIFIFHLTLCCQGF